MTRDRSSVQVSTGMNLVFIFRMGRAVTNVERTCGPTQLHIYVAIKYV